MNTTEIREIIKRELPKLVHEDAEIQDLILRLSRLEFAPKAETEDRFEKMLAKLEHDREEDSRRWEENRRERDRKWEEDKQRWEENRRERDRKWEEDKQLWAENRRELDRKWEEDKQLWAENRRELDQKWEEDKQRWEAENRRWEESRRESERLWAEDKQRWEEENRRWEESRRESERLREEDKQRWAENRRELDRKWEEDKQRCEAENRRCKEREDEHRREFDRVHEEIMALASKHDRTVGALGSRWGLASEKSFRDALGSILERNFDVRVINVTDYDEEGTVFGRPEQIELDVIVTNGSLILMELKSSMDKADMYIFERKARFYEQRHHRKADRLIVVSPMIDPRAQKVGERLGIEMFTDSVFVESL